MPALSIPSLLRLFATSVLLISSVLGASVTVDDLSSLYKYHPPTSWQDVKPLDPMLDIGASHKFTSDVGAFVEITHSFVSFCFVSALYPYEVGVHVFVDDERYPIYIDLTDHGTALTDSPSPTVPAAVPQTVVYKSNTSEYRPHILRIAVADGHKFAAFDAIIFEVPNDPSSTIFDPVSGITSPVQISTVTVTPTTDFISGTADSEQRVKLLRLSVGILGGVVGLMFTAFILWLIIHRRKRAAKDITLPPSQEEVVTETKPYVDYSLDGVPTPHVRLVAPSDTQAPVESLPFQQMSDDGTRVRNVS